MQTSTFFFLSGTLTFGVPILWAIHELVQLRRDGGGHGWPWQRDRDGASPPPPKPRGGAREHTEPLPACLIEAARGAPVSSRELERELESA